MKQITFIRHAESDANRAGIWNGRIDGPVSEDGEDQLKALGRRLASSRFDLVVSSPLERAVRTAEVFSEEVTVDDDFIELDLGKWDGWSSRQVQDEDGEALKAAVTDRSLPFGDTGESLDAGAGRISSAVGRLVGSMPEDSSAAIVTHGGLLQTYLHKMLPGGNHRVHAFVGNTSISNVKFFDDRPRLAVFNDTGHLGPRSSQVELALESGDPVFALIRHGRTQANVEQRWQGQRDWDLDELGYRQAEALSNYYGKWGTVFSSPLKRARSTAEFVSSGKPELVPELMELNMGNWEDLTTVEIEKRWPGVLERIYRGGEDLPRGETGETWAQLTDRFRQAVESLAHARAEPTVVVAHGGAIRSFISSLTATKDSHAESLFTPANTSVSHVAITDGRPMILDYGVAPHLENLPTND